MTEWKNTKGQKVKRTKRHKTRRKKESLMLWCQGSLTILRCFQKAYGLTLETLCWLGRIMVSGVDFTSPDRGQKENWTNMSQETPKPYHLYICRGTKPDCDQPYQNHTIFASPESANLTIFASPEWLNHTISTSPEECNHTISTSPKYWNHTIYTYPEYQNHTILTPSVYQSISKFLSKLGECRLDCCDSIDDGWLSAGFCKQADLKVCPQQIGFDGNLVADTDICERCWWLNCKSPIAIGA